MDDVVDFSAYSFPQARHFCLLGLLLDREHWSLYFSELWNTRTASLNLVFVIEIETSKGVHSTAFAGKFGYDRVCHGAYSLHCEDTWMLDSSRFQDLLFLLKTKVTVQRKLTTLDTIRRWAWG